MAQKQWQWVPPPRVSELGGGLTALLIALVLVASSVALLLYPVSSYYAKLVPLTLPVMVISFYASWLGWEVFKAA